MFHHCQGALGGVFWIFSNPQPLKPKYTKNGLFLVTEAYTCAVVNHTSMVFEEC